MVEHPVCCEGNSKSESVGLMQAEKTNRGRSSILLWIANDLTHWSSMEYNVLHEGKNAETRPMEIK